jgi:hypothetical protein
MKRNGINVMDHCILVLPEKMVYIGPKVLGIPEYYVVDSERFSLY